MKRIYKLHVYIISKSRFYLWLFLCFCLVVPIAIKIIEIIGIKKGQEMEINLGELLIIEFLFLIISQTYYYYRQQKGKLYLLERLANCPQLSMLFGRLLVMGTLGVLTVCASHIMIVALCPGLFRFTAAGFFLIAIVYFKIAILLSFLYILVKDTISAAVVGWFFFCGIQITAMLVGEAGDISAYWMFSYSILTLYALGDLNIASMAAWALSSCIEIVFLFFLTVRSYKKAEWR